MSYRSHNALAIVVIGVGLWALVGRATEVQNSSPAGSSDGQDALQLRVSTNATVYRQGQLIPLELSFTSKLPNRYQVNMAGYDRSGRMGYEKFVIEPADGTADPLLTYFKSESVFFGGALTNFQFLSESPYVTHLYLNEWVRFDRPGNYRVTVTSRRVSDTLGVKSFYQGTIQLLKSNSIELRIIEPDSAWQQSELKSILADLDASPPPTGPFSSGPRITAMTKLRYLGSADAARELARRLSGDEGQVDWVCTFGLVGSPNKLTGYEEMRRLLVDPDFPVGSGFLQAMAIVPLDPAEAPEALRQQRKTNLEDARSALMAAILTKRGKALAVSVDTVLRNQDPKSSSEDRSKLLSFLIAGFRELGTEKQRTWLEEQWPRIKDAAWLPTLRAIAAEYADYPVPNAPNVLPAYDYFKLSGDGLIRWYELDPEEARPAVLAEIVRQRPRYSANTLGMLPDKVLPNEEHAIAEHFLAAEGDAVEGNLASLLNRYADAAVLAEVLPKIKKKVGPWACIPEINAVAYVQRVDPEAAKPLSERVAPGCQSFWNRSDLP
jgi:hypothetical protein